MSDVSWIDKSVREALASGEKAIPYDGSHLEKVKIRLKNIRRMNMNLKIRNKTLRLSIVTAIILVLTGGALGAATTTFMKTDKIDYPFVDDSQVIGKWQSVDFVSSVGTFSPDTKTWRGDLFLKELIFIKDGKMLNSINEGNGALAPSPSNWTKGMVINPYEKTASNYEIVDIAGNQYMFYEWKNGDYVFRDMKSSYYVLRKVDGTDYSNMEIPRKTDNTDLPFVNDPSVIGSWKTVDFVETPDLFSPEKQSWISDMFLTGLIFKDEGKLTISNTKGDFSKEYLSWTKDVILDSDGGTASAYIIKEINGSKYMFYEWKSGDYVFRGMQPCYYVLARD